MDNDKKTNEEILYERFEKRFEEKLAQKVKEEEVERLKKVEKEYEELKQKMVDNETTAYILPNGSTFKVGAPDNYKGFNLKAQGQDILSKKIFSGMTEKQVEGIKRCMIDAIAPAAAEHNPLVRKAILTTGTTSGGAELMAETWFPSVILHAAEVSYALQRCRRFMINTGNTMHVPKHGTSVSFNYAGEDAALTESEPGTADFDLTAGKYGLFGKFTIEMMTDSLTDLVSYINYDVNIELPQKIDNLMFNGDAHAFTGALAGAGNTVVFGASNSATSYTNMVSKNFTQVKSAMSLARGRLGAELYGHRDLRGTFEDLVKVTGVSALYNPDKDTINGIPFNESEVITGTDATSTNFILYGNLQNYALGIRAMSSNIELNTQGGTTEWSKGEILYRFFVRACGTPVFANYFVAMKTA